MKTFIVLLLATACARQIESFPPDTTVPAFLGDLSGLYVPSAGFGEVGATVNVIEVAGQLIIAPPTAATTAPAQFTIIGPVNTAASGAAQVATTTRLPIGAAASVATLPVTVDIGFDALTVTFPSLSANNCFVPQTSAGACAFVANKSCDFDSRLAGVFSTTVTRLTQAGDCSSATELAGARQWAVTAVNGGSEASVTSVKNGQIEFALLLDFDHATETLSLDRPLPVAGQLEWQSSSSFAGSVAVTDSDVVFQAQLTRVLDSGCNEQYRATGTRQSGTKLGIACPTSVDACATIAPPVCPALPASFASGAYVQATTLDARGCPSANTCEAHLSALCPGASAVRAALGCKSGESLAISAGTDGANACDSLACASASLCGSSLAAIAGVDYCNPGDDAIVQVQSYNCNAVSCVSADAACPSRAPPCQVLDVPSAALAVQSYDDDGCAELACDFGAGFDAAGYFGTSANLLAAPYVIDHFTPALASASQPSAPVLAAASVGCPPFDLAGLAGHDLLLTRTVLSDGQTQALCFGAAP
jgi:hypothetical protein